MLEIHLLWTGFCTGALACACFSVPHTGHQQSSVWRYLHPSCPHLPVPIPGVHSIAIRFGIYSYTFMNIYIYICKPYTLFASTHKYYTQDLQFCAFSYCWAKPKQLPVFNYTWLSFVDLLLKNWKVQFRSKLGQGHHCTRYRQTWWSCTYQMCCDGMSNGRFLQIKSPDNWEVCRKLVLNTWSYMCNLTEHKLQLQT